MSFARWATQQAAALNFQSNEYRNELAASDRYARMVECAPLQRAKAYHYAAQLERVRNALRWSIDDSARTGLGRLRGEFCQDLPLATVNSELVEDIAKDLQFLEASAAEARTRELNQARINLMERLSGNPAVNEAALRVHLRALSGAAAEAREAHSRTMESTRDRLAIAAGALIALLLGVLIVMPPGLLSAFRYGGDIRERYFWMVLMFGALGAIISASTDRRPTGFDATDGHLQRPLLAVRSLIGGAVALVAYLALSSALAGIKAIAISPLDPAYLVIAVGSGVAERALAPQIRKMVRGVAAVESIIFHNPMRT